MPHEVYTWMVDRCFDCYVGEFNHKNLLKSESECVDKCVMHIKNLPV